MSEATPLVTVDSFSLPEEFLPYLSSFEAGSPNQATFSVVFPEPTLPGTWRAALPSLQGNAPDSVPRMRLLAVRTCLSSTHIVFALNPIKPCFSLCNIYDDLILKVSVLVP